MSQQSFERPASPTIAEAKGKLLEVGSNIAGLADVVIVNTDAGPALELCTRVGLTTDDLEALAPLSCGFPLTTRQMGYEFTSAELISCIV